MNLRNEELTANSNNSNDKQIRPNVPKELLDIFWCLASTNDEKRLSAVATIIEILKQNAKSSSDSESMKYTIKRLVTGLSSSRQCAPLGFATAFCELLKNFQEKISLEELLKKISEYMKVSKQDNKNHQVHVNLGKILAYTGIIRSGMLRNDDRNVQIIVRSLAKIRRKHPSLAGVTTEALSLLCRQDEENNFATVMLENLQEEITAGWQNCTADTLHLLLTLREYEVIDEEFLSEHYGSSKIVSARNFPNIAQVMNQSVLYHPMVHAVNHQLIQSAAAEGHKTFNKFWSSVVMGEVFNSDKPTRCYMVYQLIPSVLKNHINTKSVPVILCAELLGPVIKHLIHRDSFLHKAAIKMMLSVVDIVKSSEDPSFQLAVLNCLLTEPGSFMFDSVTSTKVLSSIITHLNEEACMQFSKTLMSVISKNQPLFGKSGEGVASWCSLTLTHMLTAGSMTKSADLSWQASIVKYLLLHSCFRVKSPQPDIEHCAEVVEIVDSDRKAVRESLLKAFTLLSTFNPGRKSGDPDTVNASHFDFPSFLWDITSYTSQLVKSSSLECLRPVAKEDLEVWTSATDVCKQIRNKVAKDSKAKIAIQEAFLLILELFSAHIFIVDPEERPEILDTLKEVLACHRKATLKTKSNKDEPQWSEVITEVLIGLMSKESQLFRNISTSVFDKILPVCDVSSLQLVLDVFQSADSEFDDSDGEDTDKMEEDAPNLVNGEISEANNSDADDDDENDSEEEEEEEEESELEDEDDVVDENVRAAVQAALGPAAVTDKSDEEDDDLPDDEMFKLDDALAAAFKSTQNSKTSSAESVEKRRQIGHFKLRCLDLVDVVAKNSAKGELLLELIVPLLTLIESGYKDKDMKDVGKKARTVYQHLISRQKLPKTDVSGRENINDAVKSILQLSCNAYVGPIMKEIASGVILMIKLISNSEDKRNPHKTEAGKASAVSMVIDPVKDALAEFLSKRDSRYNQALFHIIFERQPMLFWPCVKDLMNAVSNADVRIFCRTQACGLLMVLLNKSTVPDTTADSWSGISQLVSPMINSVASFSVDSFKTGFLHEFFNLLLKIRSLDKHLVIDASGFSSISSKFNKELMKAYRKLANMPSTPNVQRSGHTVTTSSTKQNHTNTPTVSAEDPNHQRKRKIPENKDSVNGSVNGQHTEVQEHMTPVKKIKGKNKQ